SVPNPFGRSELCLVMSPPRLWRSDDLTNRLGITEMKKIGCDEGAAIARLLRFLGIDGITGHEETIGREIMAALLEGGVPRHTIRGDDANTRIPLPTQTGNLIVSLPGTCPGPRRMFACHMDTVPSCAGAKPKRQGSRIVSAADTALGGDNRTGVACLV